ncbi:MAG: hydroxyisourate hydrolase [Azospirillaceae bacterium]
MGRLTTHVLDTANGRPAAGLAVRLSRRDPVSGRYDPVREIVTNADGRGDGPLVEGPDFVAARYELVFAVGAYFAGLGLALPDPPFLDEVPVRFAIADAAVHYHVPLLVSPWSYTTYRGS